MVKGYRAFQWKLRIYISTNKNVVLLLGKSCLTRRLMPYFGYSKQIGLFVIFEWILKQSLLYLNLVSVCEEILCATQKRVSRFLRSKVGDSTTFFILLRHRKMPQFW